MTNPSKEIEMTRKYLPGLLTVAPMRALCAWPGEDGAPEPTLADTLGEAFDAHSDDGAATGNETPPADEPATTSGTPAATPSAAPAAAGPQRDAQGRFVAKEGPATATPMPTHQGPGGTPMPTPQAPGGPATPMPAPASWTPAAREFWGQIPAGAQVEIARRETEMARAMTENASARSIAQNLSDTITPYLGRMRMQGVTPLQAIDNLLQTESMLGMGTQQQRAETIARLVKAYGVDVQALDAALVGEPMPQNHAVDAQVQALVQQQLAPFHQFMQQAQAHQQQAWQTAQTQVGGDLQAFAADPKNEFFQDVRLIMADLIDVAQKHGQLLNLQEAYDRAVLMHPQIRGVIEARQQAQAAANLNGAAQRARRAAVGVTGAPALGAPDNASGELDLRGQIAASMDALTRV